MAWVCAGGGMVSRATGDGTLGRLVMRGILVGVSDGASREASLSDTVDEG